MSTGEGNRWHRSARQGHLKAFAECKSFQKGAGQQAFWIVLTVSVHPSSSAATEHSSDYRRRWIDL